MDENKITTDEWLAELQKWESLNEQEAADGMSAPEVRKLLGLGANRTYEFLRAGIDQGFIKMRHRTRISIIGRRVNTPVYVLYNPREVR